MHDIDRTLTDSEFELEAFEADADGEYDEYEHSFELEAEADDYEDEYEHEYEYEFEGGYGEGVFDEAEEMELASELLSVGDDEELEYFLGRVIRRAGRRVRRFVKSKTGRALRKGLKRVAKRLLPTAGRAVGTLVGGPLGGRIGSRVARVGGRALGLELEGLSPEDQELEVAKRIVRLTADAAKNAATQSSSGDSDTDAKRALLKAVKKQAPGLVPSAKAKPSMAGALPGRSGRWVQRGHKIVLMGVR